MTSILKLSLIFVVTIGCGDAFYLNDISETRRHVYDCLNAHRTLAGKGYSCYDDQKLQPCLQNITAESKSDKHFLDSRLKRVEERIRKCPGFAGQKICRNGESSKCKDNFETKQLLGDNSICNELQEVRDCLYNKLNDSCIDDVIAEELFSVEKVDKDCKAGNFNGGPCSVETIFACTAAIYFDDSGNGCTESAHHKAKECLRGVFNKCKTAEQHDLVLEAMSLLKSVCTFN